MMIARLFGAAVLFFLASELHAQEMEPRAYSDSPSGLNFLIAGTSYSSGRVLLDPTRVSLHYEQHKGMPTTCFGETEYFITDVRVVE